MKGFESQIPQAPQVKSPEEVLREEHQEKIELTWNALQFYVAKKSTTSGEEALLKVLKASGEEFSASGLNLLRERLKSTSTHGNTRTERLKRLRISINL